MTPSATALIVLAGLTSLVAAGAIVVGPSPWRRGLAAAIAIAALWVPWWIPEEELALRAFGGFFALFPTMRTLELARERRDPPLAMRFAYFFTPLDVREAKRTTPRLDAVLALRTLAHALVAALGYAVIVLAPRDAVLVRIVGAAVLLYGLVDALSNVVRAIGLAAGWDAPEMQRHPILSESVSELWGRRWNRPVSSWLRRVVFTPVARRAGVRTGTLAAFAVSGAFHFYPVWVAIGLGPALAMAAYFVVQGVLALIEPALHVARWPRPLRHAWTVVAVAAPSPLFLHPMLACVGAI